jgi:hypothetical protein
MTVTITEALNALRTAVQDLLPVPADPALAPDIQLNPLRFHSAGIGGVLNVTTQAPIGEREARRLEALLVLRVKAANVAGLSAAASTFSSALVGADPMALRSRGIFRVRRDLSIADETFDAIAPGAGRDIHFNVLYEFVKPPAASAGLVDTVTTDVMQSFADAQARELFSSDFATDPLAQFDVVNDSGANGPGDWQYDAVNREIIQVAPASGGSNNFNASKRGTYLVLRPGVVPELARNFVLYASVRSDASGGIGLVFRFVDADNYYFFLMNRPAPYRLLARKVADVTAFVASGGQQDGTGYVPGEWQQLRLLVQDDEFELAIDGIVVLRGRDPELTAAGSVGFMSRNNSGARFRLLRWLAL